MPQLLNRRRSVSLCLCFFILLAIAPAAFAQPFNWLLPQGGETWTAGTTHTVEWSGGPAGNVIVYAISIVPFQVADAIAVNVPNTGYVQWTIPGTLAPGQYQVFVGDPTFTTYLYGPIFNVQSGPNCGAGCTVVAANIPFYNYPGGPCGSSILAANAAALAYIQPLIVCPGGSTLDQTSVMVDVTILPFGSCFAGYGGQYIAEASAVYCCCQDPVRTEKTTWGAIKAMYR